MATAETRPSIDVGRHWETAAYSWVGADVIWMVV